MEDKNLHLAAKRQKIYENTLNSGNSYVLAGAIIDEIYDRLSMKLHLTDKQLGALFKALIDASFYNDYADMEMQFSAIAVIYVHAIKNEWRNIILSLVMDMGILDEFADVCVTCQYYQFNYFIVDYRIPFSKSNFYETIPNDYRLGVYI